MTEKKELKKGDLAIVLRASKRSIIKLKYKKFCKTVRVLF